MAVVWCKHFAKRSRIGGGAEAVVLPPRLSPVGGVGGTGAVDAPPPVGAAGVVRFAFGRGGVGVGAAVRPVVSADGVSIVGMVVMEFGGAAL